MFLTCFKSSKLLHCELDSLSQYVLIYVLYMTFLCKVSNIWKFVAPINLNQTRHMTHYVIFLVKSFPMSCEFFNQTWFDFLNRIFNGQNPLQKIYEKLYFNLHVSMSFSHWNQ